MKMPIMDPGKLNLIVTSLDLHMQNNPKEGSFILEKGFVEDISLEQVNELVEKLAKVVRTHLKAKRRRRAQTSIYEGLITITWWTNPWWRFW